MSVKINRRDFLGAAVAGTVAASSSQATQTPKSAPKRPNVLFILADDLGWGDLSCYGRPDYRTPNLDRLAAEGTRLTQAYSASPVCTPTRAAFTTGRYPGRTAVGLEEPLTWRESLRRQKRDVGLPPEHPTVASLLKASGYRTSLVGKWHLGYLPKYSPVKSGYEEFFGIMSGGADYLTHVEAFGENDLFEMETPVERAGYMTDLLTERAVEFLSRRHERPFYLSLHYTAPHWPWEAPGERVERPAGALNDGWMTAGGSLKLYAEMMRSLDEGVGRVVKALRDARLERTTLVVFTSDNGGERFSYQWPFRGEKFWLYEGGLRVPAIVRWPGVVPANKVSPQVAITMDWTATFLAAAGARADANYPLDGEDLLPVLRGARAPFDRTLFWSYGTQAAAREGRWKYFRRDEKTEFLYDLSTDEREQSDFKTARPEVLADLRGKHARWESQMLKRPERRV